MAVKRPLVTTSGDVRELLAADTLVVSAIATISTVSTTGNILALATGSAAISFIRLTGAAPVIQGLSGGSAGRIVVLCCIGGGSVSVIHNDPAASAANRYFDYTTVDYAFSGDGAQMAMIYDSTSALWRRFTYM